MIFPTILILLIRFRKDTDATNSIILVIAILAIAEVLYGLNYINPSIMVEGLKTMFSPNYKGDTPAHIEMYIFFQIGFTFLLLIGGVYLISLAFTKWFDNLSFNEVRETMKRRWNTLIKFIFSRKKKNKAKPLKKGKVYRSYLGTHNYSEVTELINENILRRKDVKINR